MKSLLGQASILHHPEDLLLYECDGSVEKGRPDLVVFPETTEEVSGFVKLAARHEVPLVGRDAGSGLSGGALARSGGVMIVFGRMNQIMEIDLVNRHAVVQLGVENLDIPRVVEVERLTEVVESQSAAIESICAICHAREVRSAKEERERDLLWKGRKNAFGALGRVAPSNLMQRVHDAFHPDFSLNPGKVFPLHKGCDEFRSKKTQPAGARA